ncbi:MAG: bifunctional methylenetetrahydrofolate dehydrogenase/methenyltetrahydrofolate cyclohydrolase FolD [Planctomycetota bacterium]|nr:MAG: bifunctional methylenetetrahydrofolate dehydrogenase/methenyltetrahydrofolate cyclohydrolase FolD [Planctomycetota bacterium]
MADAMVLDGKSTAAAIRAEIAEQVAQWKTRSGVTPTLAAVLVGDDPASQVYVRNKERACEKAGMDSRLVRLPAETTTEELLQQLDRLNQDAAVHGILVQLPLPKHIDAQSVLDRVSPNKDVDAFAAENVGLLVQGRPRFLPCTPHGVVHLLHRYGLPVQGRHVVIVGRSDIVGKPLANMLVARDCGLGQEYANATVTVCHSLSRSLADITRSADILVAAVGQPRLITADMVQPGAVVIDVGINRTDQGLVGDVDYDAVRSVASAITPVPGGVGPLTIAMLLQNTFAACRLQTSPRAAG